MNSTRDNIPIEQLSESDKEFSVSTSICEIVSREEVLDRGRG